MGRDQVLFCFAVLPFYCCYLLLCHCVTPPLPPLSLSPPPSLSLSSYSHSTPPCPTPSSPPSPSAAPLFLGATALLLILPVTLGFSPYSFIRRRSKIIHTTNVPAAIGPYSQAVLSPDSKTLYASGCIGLTPTWQFVGPTG